MIMEMVRITAAGASANCCATVSPEEISAPAAATKATMARRPFISSGPDTVPRTCPSGAENANACWMV